MNDENPRVLSISPRNPSVRTVQVVRKVPTGYLIGILQALRITIRHFFRNVIARRDTETVQYPEQTLPAPERFRGLHRLMKREDGRVRCVACMLCPSVCPAHCITIVPTEVSDPAIEKAPALFEIDELRCIVCGLCVEACPCDAIRMDTGIHALPSEERGPGVETLETMLARGGLSTAVQGGIEQSSPGIEETPSSSRATDR